MATRKKLHHKPELPFEFCVFGTPVSHQSKDKTRLQEWRNKVAARAETVWNRSPLRDRLLVTITHYHEERSGVPDSDNIVKPVRDSLQSIIYFDDFQISDFRSGRRNLNSPFIIKGLTPELAEGFCSGEEFLHILIQQALDEALLISTKTLKL